MPHELNSHRERRAPDLTLLAVALERAAEALHAAAREAERATLVPAQPETRPALSDTRLLTVAEAAKALRLSRSKLYAHILCGDIPSITLGRSRRIPATALANWIERQQAEGF